MRQKHENTEKFKDKLNSSVLRDLYHNIKYIHTTQWKLGNVKSKYIDTNV